MNAGPKVSDEQRIVQFLAERGARGATSIEFVTVLEICSYTQRVSDINKKHPGLVLATRVGTTDNGRAKWRYTLTRQVPEAYGGPPATADALMGGLFDPGPALTPQPVSAIAGEL